MKTCLCEPFMQHPDCELHPSRLRELQQAVPPRPVTGEELAALPILDLEEALVEVEA